MSHSKIFSRPARAAAALLQESEEQVEHLFRRKRVAVRFEERSAQCADARECYLFAVNQILRFCPNVATAVPRGYDELLSRGVELGQAIHQTDCVHPIRNGSDLSGYDAVLNIGTEMRDDLPWVAVNSKGWIARISSARSECPRLPNSDSISNVCGALGAACLGAGATFLMILGKKPAWAFEISLFSLLAGAPGTLKSDPPLPQTPLQINSFLVGCGAVSNGWTYAMKRLPVVGHIEAIDRQRFRAENLGPYVLSDARSLKARKSDIITEALTPNITATPRAEEWELFKIRLRYGLPIPPIIVNGLDNVLTRHSVQRLWPATLIDMAAGGLTSQVIVKNSNDDGICLLRALQVPPDELDWADRLSGEIGISADRIRCEPTTEISQADIDAAETDFRAALAQDRGRLICGRVTEQNLDLESDNPDFAPAVPFVTAFSGVTGAAQTMRYLMGQSKSLHFQQSFGSGRGRVLQVRCEPGCICHVG